MDKYKPTVLFDFDGVMHKYTSGWQGPSKADDGIVPGIRDVISDLMTDHKVMIFSTRAASEEGKLCIQNFCIRHGIIISGVTHKKVPAKLVIDDRCITFRGETQGLAEQIRTYKTWTELDEESND